MRIMVIDVGTSSMRGIVFNEHGEKVLSVSRKYSSEHSVGGAVWQEAGTWTKELLEISSTIAEKMRALSSKLDVISITSQRSSVIPVNREGIAVTPAIMWQDTRNAQVCREISENNEFIFERSGTYCNTVFSGGKMSWFKRTYPQKFKEVYKFNNIPEYLIHIMTGEYRTDYTYGSRSNLMNIRSCSWDRELLDIFNIEESYLSELTEPGSIVGCINQSFAEKTGISLGTPVISAGGDQQCAAIGQGAFQEGSVSIVTGTGGYLVAAAKKLPEILKPDVIWNASSISGQYIMEANVLACCAAFDWYCDNFYNEIPESEKYNKVNLDLAEIYEAVTECLVVPYFRGRSMPDWNAEAKATFTNITLATKRQEILKAILEGICMEMANHLEQMGHYTEIEKIYISGGLSNSPSFNQMQADVYGKQIRKSEDSESTALGALIVTLSHMGIYQTVDEAYRKIKSRYAEEIYDGSASKYGFYQERKALMNRTYQQLCNISMK